MQEPPPVTGLILLAHGSRDAQWRAPMEAVCAAVRQRQPQGLCACAYLEACEPDLPGAAAELVALGARRLLVLPLFLGTGKHARQDIPRIVSAWSAVHPQIPMRLEAAVGENPAVIALLADLALQAGSSWMPQQPDI